MPNRLAHETSPYLRQHADNPVDWYPWGEEALLRAKAEDRPIFLSVGYSACHWCHVMERESFEDPQVADILNRDFVSIKVDREERPDLDRVYMDAVQTMTGHGGWPMSLFLTPDGRPFYAGTYFPPAPRHGLPSFRELLLALAGAWRNRRQEVLKSGERVVAALRRQSAVAEVERETALQPETSAGAFRALRGEFDPVQGGWGDHPKFPQPMVLEFLLRHHITTSDPEPLRMASQTLEAMARGGIYDQLGGGFHRYSVDERWLVPHFEKMLYDNALLARVYLHAWQVAGYPLFRAVAEETLDYVARELLDPAGGFYSTQDADSEGVEGKFYVWTPEEIRSVLGSRTASFLTAYGVTVKGNFEGNSILTLVGSLEKRGSLASARRKLLAARARRIPPGRDEKVLASWNGLMLAAFAEAARALDRRDYLAVAERNAAFLLDHLRAPDGRLRHTWKEGMARVDGFLEDYTHLAEGLLELYRTTFEPRWYRAARELVEVMIDHFSAPVGFFDTSDDHETLIVRPRELQDNAVPSGNGMAATVLPRVAGLAGEPRYPELAERSLGRMQPMLARYPLGFGQWLIALDYLLSHPREIAILGDPRGADTQALLEACAAGYRPHQVVAVGRPEEEANHVPALRDRGLMEGRATAYLCIDHSCRPPVTDPAELQALLKG